jgi:uncharacterized protein (UPF0332 family)
LFGIFLIDITYLHFYDVELRAVQVLLSIGGVSKVRINGEVQGNFEAKLNVAKEKGELIYENEVEFAGLRSLLDEDANFAHITMIRTGNTWCITFSFLYGIEDAEATLAIGKEFLDSAKQDINKGRWRSAINNLGIASEQIARAALNLHPLDGDHRSSKKHSTVSNSINRYSHITDIIPAAYAKAHNELMEWRDKARYDVGFAPRKKRLQGIVKEIDKFYADLLAVLAPHQ